MKDVSTYAVDGRTVCSASDFDRIKPHTGCLIRHAGLTNNFIVLVFECGHVFTFRDDGQDCCEKRYTTTDDDIRCLIGQKFVECRISNVSRTENDGVDEMAFFEIQGDSSVVSFCFHNESNGYYCGIDLVMDEFLLVDKHSEPKPAQPEPKTKTIYMRSGCIDIDT